MAPPVLVLTGGPKSLLSTCYTPIPRRPRRPCSPLTQTPQSYVTVPQLAQPHIVQPPLACGLEPSTLDLAPQACPRNLILYGFLACTLPTDHFRRMESAESPKLLTCCPLCLWHEGQRSTPIPRFPLRPPLIDT
jgi:hypothetical protein